MLTRYVHTLVEHYVEHYYVHAAVRGVNSEPFRRLHYVHTANRFVERVRVTFSCNRFVERFRDTHIYVIYRCVLPYV